MVVKNEFMMKNIFGDIFRSVLFGLSGQPPGFLINLIIEYIEVCFHTAKQEDIDGLLRITVHFIKNIDNIPQNEVFFQRVLIQVIQLAPKLTQIVEEDTTDFFLEIIEEFVIVGITPQMFDYNAYMIQLYTSLSKTMVHLVPIDMIFKLKSSLFSIHTTLLLLALEKNTYKFSDFEVF